MAIRAEACGCHRALEGEVVQEHSAAPVDEQGPAILIDGQQQASVWAEAERSYLQLLNISHPSYNR